MALIGEETKSLLLRVHSTQKYTTMHDYSKSEFAQKIRISDEQLDKIKRIKGKKSSAGKLKEIINFYMEKHKL